MKNFVVYMDTENRREACRMKLEIRRILKNNDFINWIMDGEEKQLDYMILNNRCYAGIKLDYESPNTGKIWAMISKYNAEMVHKYPTLKMSS